MPPGDENSKYDSLQKLIDEIVEIGQGIHDSKESNVGELKGQIRSKFLDFERLMNMSQVELAAKLGVSVQTLGRWKDGSGAYLRARPSLEHFEILRKLIKRFKYLGQEQVWPTEVGLWTWKDLCALDETDETLYVWIVSSDHFGEAISRKDLAALLERLEDPNRKVTYIYVFPKGSAAALDYEEISEYLREYHSKPITGSVMGIGLPEEGKHSLVSLHQTMQAVLYEQKNEVYAFLGFPDETSLSATSEFKFVWKLMPSSVMVQWQRDFFTLLRATYRSILKSKSIQDFGNSLDAETQDITIYPSLVSNLIRKEQ